ncbi:MAG: hypothetical protein ACK5LY_11115 [Lachnospirales bacterium]
MENLLEIREELIYYYKKHEDIYNTMLKIIFYSIVFKFVLDIGLYDEKLSFLFTGVKGILVYVACVAFAIFCSNTLTLGLILAFVAAGLSKYLALDIIVVLILLCIYFMYARVATRENILILVTFFAFLFKVPYLAGFIAGIFFSPTSVIAIGFGAFIYYIFNFVTTSANASMVAVDVGEVLENVDGVLSDFSGVITGILSNTDWIYIAFVICAGVLAINIINRFSIKYNFYISLICASIIYFVGTIFIVLFTNFEGSVIVYFLGLIFSTLVAFVMQFFKVVLDYNSPEKVQFFDGENYYYVKIIPRYIVKKNKSKRNIQQKRDMSVDMAKINTLAREQKGK